MGKGREMRRFELADDLFHRTSKLAGVFLETVCATSVCGCHEMLKWEVMAQTGQELPLVGHQFRVAALGTYEMGI